MRMLAIISVPVLLVAGCAQDRGGFDPGPPPGTISHARAALSGSSGLGQGEATLTQVADGIRVAISVSGLAPGVHGVHIHETGSCFGPDFASAGGHWNPLDRQHGRENPAGRHMGDLPNLIVGQNGEGRLEAVIEGATFDGRRSSLLDDDGAAIVVHAGADDYRTDPSGLSGARIACGEIVPG